MIRRLAIAAVVLAFLSTLPAFAGSKSGTVIDEGTFAIFQSGRQIGTEKFSVTQYEGTSVTTATLRADVSPQGKGNLEQQATLTLRPDSSLVRYEWKQVAPSRSSAVVEPDQQILLMHVNDEGKKTDEPYFLSSSSAFVLDDYFFIGREVLLWRYEASSCRPHPNDSGCDLTRARFPILVPHRRTSSEVYVEFKGYDDLPLNGRPQHLRHFVIDTDGPQWHLWIDDRQKLLRIAIPAAQTEILRQ